MAVRTATTKKPANKKRCCGAQGRNALPLGRSTNWRSHCGKQRGGSSKNQKWTCRRIQGIYPGNTVTWKDTCTPMFITVQPKVGSGCPLLTAIKESAGKQGGGWPHVQRPTPPTDSQRARAFLGWGKGYVQTAESDGHLETGHPMVWPVPSWLFQVQLIFSSTVDCSPFPCGQLLDCGSLYTHTWSWLQFCHYVVTYSACFNICKTAHREWLRILSIALRRN